MGRKDRNRAKYENNVHHIIPKSRDGEDNVSNTSLVNKAEHRKYHELFKNKTPDEIILYLVHHFWNGQAIWVHKALKQLNHGLCYDYHKKEPPETGGG